MIKRLLPLLLCLGLLAFTSCKERKENITAETKALLSINQTFPKQIGNVNDFMGVFTKEEIADIDNFIDEFEKQTTNEIAVVLFKSTPIDVDFYRYCMDLSSNWGVGKKGKDNGVVFVIDIENKRGSIITGCQIMHILPNEICNAILKENIFPYFRQELYYKGVMSGLHAIVSNWNTGELDL